MGKFHDRMQTKKGDVSEDYTDDYFMNELLNIVYEVKNKDRSHPFDKIMYGRLPWEDADTDSHLFMVDIKSKTAMIKYWDGTGIDYNDYLEYSRLSIKHNMVFLLVFVDEVSGKVYGNTLTELEKECVGKDNTTYPLTLITHKRSNYSRLYCLQSMIQIFTLTPEQIKVLQSLTK
jgi:hypothetical protein